MYFNSQLVCNDKYKSITHSKNTNVCAHILLQKFKVIYHKKRIHNVCLTYGPIAHNSYFPLLGWHVVAFTN